MGENLEEKVAELSVCCESCTNRLDKLEARVAQCVAWIEQKARHELIAGYGGYSKEELEEKVKAVFPD